MAEPVGDVALLDLVAVRLVLSIAEHGTIGAAADRLHMAQPSASQRLAVLERRLGVRLFERDTRGARTTAAGEEFVSRGKRAVALLAEAVIASRSPTGSHISVGTIGSLAPAVYPALLRVLPDLTVRQVTDHGAVLATAVVDGALDAAVIGLAAPQVGKRGIRRVRLGSDRLVVLRPSDAKWGAGADGLRGSTVVVAAYSDDGPQITNRLSRRGATTVAATGTVTALAMARQQRWLAAVPATTALRERRPDEESRPLRIPVEAPIWLLTGGPKAAVLEQRSAALARELGLR